MELNILNHEAAYNDKIFSGSGEYSIDNEFVLPDYYPEISKVLKCRVVPRVSMCSLSGQTLNVDGNITVNLIYCSPENEIFGFEQIVNFSKAFEIGCDVSGALSECSAKCEYVNCRPMNERKIEVHGAVGIYAKVFKKTTTGIVSDIDNCDVIIRRGLLPATSPVGAGEKSLLIEEELELSQGQPSIRCILKYDAKAVNKECKIISGKVVEKGELNVFVLYCAEHTAAPQIYRNCIPYSQIIDIEGLHDNCVCSVKTKVASLEIKPRTSATGETRSFMLCSRLNFCATASCEDDLPVVLDAYSTKYNAEIKTQEIKLEKIQKNLNDTFICKKALENIGDISSVVDIWCETNVTDADINGCNLKIIGTMQICMLAIGSNNIPVYIERPVEFEYKYVLEECMKPLGVKAEVITNNVSFNLQSSSSIEVCAELCVMADIFTKENVSLVTDICIDENSLKQKSGDSALVIYYADEGEHLWDIARKYNSSPQEISEINSLQDEILLTKKTLLIPIK